MRPAAGGHANDADGGAVGGAGGGGAGVGAGEGAGKGFAPVGDAASSEPPPHAASVNVKNGPLVPRTKLLAIAPQDVPGLAAVDQQILSDDVAGVYAAQERARNDESGQLHGKAATIKCS